jgi:2-deoxy-D-gluconate 3-dehydrogenase
MQLFDLNGKVAIVTGGNGGIGFGMAKGLAQAGATVAIAGRNAAKSDKAVRELEKLGGKGFAVTVDVTQEDSVAAMVRDVVGKAGRVDILVNNAGINIRKLPQDMALTEWHQVLDANLTSAFLCSKAVYPEMKKAGRGKILNNGSMMSIFGAPFVPAYGASKGGIMQLTRALATAWAKDQIQVNCFLPGWIDTDLTQNARKEIAGLNERVLGRSPTGRWGHIDDFAGIAVFLSSAASDFITGTAIPVDGGFSVSG